MGDTSIEQIGRTVLFSSGKLAESHLTRRLFGQILRHIERLTWHPARRLTPSVGRPLDQVGDNPGGSVSEGGTQGGASGEEQSRKGPLSSIPHGRPGRLESVRLA